MAAPKGNQFWKARAKHGRDKTFSSPEALLESCYEYFQWTEDNPLMAAELVKFQGEATLAQVPKMRAMTISGLCIFLDIDVRTWNEYKNKESYKDFFPVISHVEGIIYNQKLQGAAADMLNANIISRELGLTDKQDHSHKGAVGNVGITVDTVDEYKKLYQEMIEEDDC